VIIYIISAVKFEHAAAPSPQRDRLLAVSICSLGPVCPPAFHQASGLLVDGQTISPSQSSGTTVNWNCFHFIADQTNALATKKAERLITGFCYMKAVHEL
jgi:hypothetical protein